jgi:hypothetical protein
LCPLDYWYSAKQTLRTLDVCSPPLPSSLSTGPTVLGLPGHCRQVNVTWPAVPGATAYRIYWQVPGSRSYSYDNAATGATSWTSPAILFVGTTYNFWVQARCSSGSTLQTVNTPVTAYTTCSGLARYAEGELFSGNIGEVQYVNMKAEDISQFINDNVTDNLVHTVQIANDGQLQVSTPTPEMLVFPNPAQDEVNISFKLINQEEKVNLELIDNSGKVVLTKAMMLEDNLEGEFHLNIGNLPSGMYFVKLTGGNFVKVDKLTIIQP